eukprot:19925-Pleurochrysis_carterae.AAC.1
MAPASTEDQLARQYKAGAKTQRAPVRRMRALTTASGERMREKRQPEEACEINREERERRQLEAGTPVASSGGKC